MIVIKGGDSLIKIFIDYSKNTQFSLNFRSIFTHFFAQFKNIRVFFHPIYFFRPFFTPIFFVFGPFLPQFFCFRPFFTPIFLFQLLITFKVGWFERRRQFRLEQIRLEQPQKQQHRCFLLNRWPWRGCVDAWRACHSGRSMEP